MPVLYKTNNRPASSFKWADFYRPTAVSTQPISSQPSDMDLAARFSQNVFPRFFLLDSQRTSKPLCKRFGGFVFSPLNQTLGSIYLNNSPFLTCSNYKRFFGFLSRTPLAFVLFCGPFRLQAGRVSRAIRKLFSSSELRSSFKSIWKSAISKKFCLLMQIAFKKNWPYLRWSDQLDLYNSSVVASLLVLDDLTLESKI